MDSLGLTSIHLDSLGLTWIPLDPLGLQWLREVYTECAARGSMCLRLRLHLCLRLRLRVCLLAGLAGQEHGTRSQFTG